MGLGTRLHMSLCIHCVVVFSILTISTVGGGGGGGGGGDQHL